MAKKPKNNPADIAKATSKMNELRIRILFLVGALIVFRAGTFIPVPGVDPAAKSWRIHLMREMKLCL